MEVDGPSSNEDRMDLLTVIAVGMTIKTDLEISTENFGWVLITYIGYSVSVKVEMNFELILETAKEIEFMQNIRLLLLVMKARSALWV